MADPGFYEITVQPIEPVDTRVLARQIVSSNARGEQQLGSPNIVSDSGNSRIRVSDDTTNRVIMGNIGVDLWGLKVSKPGKDVLTAVDADLIFNSQNNAFKIISSDTLSITAPGSVNTATVTIVHNLGFVPAFLAYLLFGGVYYQLPFTAYSDYSGVAANSWIPTFWMNGTADSTNFKVTVGSNGFTGGVYSVKYYLLQETAN